MRKLWEKEIVEIVSNPDLYSQWEYNKDGWFSLKIKGQWFYATAHALFIKEDNTGLHPRFDKDVIRIGMWDGYKGFDLYYRLLRIENKRAEEEKAHRDFPRLQEIHKALTST